MKSQIRIKHQFSRKPKTAKEKVKILFRCEDFTKLKSSCMNFHDYPFLSHAFGFGLMDAGRMVEMAEKWKLAPPQQKCSEEYNGGEGII